MKAHEILDVLISLSRSQGMYGRMLSYWEENGMLLDVLKELEKENFNDSLDLILFLEC